MKHLNSLCEGITKIIQIMNDIIYTPPYPILFGRINISKKKPKKEISKQNETKSKFDGQNEE